MNDRQHWPRTLVVNQDLPEPVMSYRILAALEPYRDYPEVKKHISELRDRLPARAHAR